MALGLSSEITAEREWGSILNRVSKFMCACACACVGASVCVRAWVDGWLLVYSSEQVFVVGVYLILVRHPA